MNKRGLFLLYLLQCLIGVIIGFYLYRTRPELGAWCLISIILVLAPERKDALTLALNRIKANLVGAAVGLILFFIHPMNLFMMSLGVILAVVICELLKLQAVTRSAAVAVIIILMHEPGRYFYDVALERAAGVIGGCGIAMLLTFTLHTVLKKSGLMPEYADNQPQG